MSFRAKIIWDFAILMGVLAGFGIVMIMFFGSPANASPLTPAKMVVYCSSDGALEEILKTAYLEVPIRESFTDVGNGGVFTWWRSFEDDLDTRTWSLTVKYPDGKVCLIASGKMNWEPVGESAPNEDVPVW